MRRVAILMLIPLLGWSAGALAQSVVLVREAMIDSEQVTVEQVAKVDWPADQAAAAQVAGLVLRPAPTGGNETLTLAEFRSRLAELGVNRAVWSVQGAAACRISKVPSPQEQLAKAQAQSQAMHSVAAQVADAVNLPDSLAGTIRKLLADRFEQSGGTIAARFEPGDRAVLTLRQPEFRFEPAIRRVTDSFVEVAVQIHGPAGSDQPARSADIRVRVELTAQAVVARRQINRGQVIEPNDVQLAARQVALGCSPLSDTAAVVGQQAKRSIRPDEILSVNDLAPQTLVSRNKLVTVYARSGAMTVKTVGRAMQDGFYGQQIMVRNESSRQAFTAVVTGPDTVSLDRSAAQGGKASEERS